MVGTELVVVEEVAGHSAGPPASPSSLNATTPRRVIRAAASTYQRRHQGTVRGRPTSCFIGGVLVVVDPNHED